MHKEAALTRGSGVLVECDPSIKAIINRIHEQHGHDIIIEDIDDEHVLIKNGKLDELKLLLKDVSAKQPSPRSGYISLHMASTSKIP